MTDTPEYTPPKVWVWNKANGGRYSGVSVICNSGEASSDAGGPHAIWAGRASFASRGAAGLQLIVQTFGAGDNGQACRTANAFHLLRCGDFALRSRLEAHTLNLHLA